MRNKRVIATVMAFVLALGNLGSAEITFASNVSEAAVEIETETTENAEPETTESTESEEPEGTEASENTEPEETEGSGVTETGEAEGTETSENTETGVTEDTELEETEASENTETEGPEGIETSEDTESEEPEGTEVSENTESEEPENTETEVPEETETESEETELSDGISVQGASSFGRLFANELAEEVSEQRENNGNNIFSAEVEGNLAVVEYESLADAGLIVGIYDEAGVQLLASGYAVVSADETEAAVEILDGSIPAYYYVRAFLIDPDTRQPLGTAYESPMYTQEMQEFLAKTTADFDAERVLNLDADAADNFAVFGENTILIPESAGYNDVVTADDVNNVYVIENADSSVLSLQPGDIFSYSYTDDEVLIVKVAVIDINGTTVTITGADSSMEEVFDYVKIDAEAASADVIVDESACTDGVTYEGLVDDVSMTREIEGGGKLGMALSYQIAERKFGDENGVKISGNLEFKLESSVKFYASSSYQYLECRLDYTAKLGASVSGKAKGALTLGHLNVSPVPEVYITITPSVILEVSGKVTLDGKLKGTVGVRVASDTGAKNLTSVPKLEQEWEAEGTVFVGLSMEPAVKIFSDGIAKAQITAEVGAEAKAEPKRQQSDGKTKHTCNLCLDGEVNGKLEVTAGATFVNKWKFTLKAMDVTVKITDFYYSADKKEFGWTVCPYWLYRMTALVLDEAGTPVSGAAVSGTDVPGNTATDAAGKAEFWLSAKTHNLVVTKDGYQKQSKTVHPQKGGEQVTLRLQKKSGSGGGEAGTAGTIEGKVKQVSLGGLHSAAITERGDLYLWGYNRDGRLGNGTTTDSSFVPIKVMENVREVSLGGCHSAVITKSGELYLWGGNSLAGQGGQLGNGTTTDSSVPIKVMENVREVSLGGYHSAVITENGDLYLWGYNGQGQLGNGTMIGSSVPVKVMENVREVSLGFILSAAITESGDLYLWGSNNYGELGNEIVSFVPEKVMENIREVSLGERHSAAITGSGDLYLWDSNDYGQLGNGTTTDSSVPIKVMENVREVSLGPICSAAITENGDLYLWGYNGQGQLGNGTRTDIHVPEKVMEDVKEVSIGMHHSAAITENGDLYLWGNNDYGQLGNGTRTNSLVPIRINRSARAASLAYAASTENTASADTAALAAASEVEELFAQPDSLRLAAVPENWNGSGFSHLIPNEVYNYYVMKDADAGEPFANGNLLYIGQALSGADGTLSPQLSLREQYADADYFAVPMHQADISSVGVTVPKLTYNGRLQYAVPAVVWNGMTLVPGTDYDVQGDYGVTDAGNYTLTITGTGLYTGTVNVSYTVAPCAHSYGAGAVTTKATCAKEGVKTYTCSVCGNKKTESVAKTAHSYGAGAVTTKATCAKIGVKTYTCSVCGNKKTESIAKMSHSYGKKTVAKKATTKKNGSTKQTCKVCGKQKTATVYAAKTIKLSSASYTYNGKAKKPGVTVTDSKGKKLKKDTDYTVSYSSGRKKVGQYTVTVKLKGSYSGTVKKTFTIKPKGTSVSKVSGTAKGFTVKWKKQKTETTGYQIQYSTSSKFIGKSTKTVTIDKNGTTSKKITKLKANKKYYVRIRTYKTVKVNGKSKKLYSDWSKAKSVKTKK